MHEQIKKIITTYNENKMAHAFLIDTNYKDKCIQELKSLFKIIECSKTYQECCDDNSCNICELIENNQLTNIVFINAENNLIKKEQITDLITKFKSKPLLGKYLIYIIKDAESFNTSSANTLLKFLEEPEANIVAFLLKQDNSYVLPTIKSRCQSLRIIYNDLSITDIEIVTNLFENFIYFIDNNKLSDFFVYKQKKLEHNKDITKDIIKNVLLKLINYYHDMLKNIKLKDNKLNLNNIKLVKLIKLLDNSVDNLFYNVNLDLFLDKLFIEVKKIYD